jgi:hypothetical protein
MEEFTVTAPIRMQVSRRQFLAGGALLASATTLGFSGIFGLGRTHAADGDSVEIMLNVAATAETFACTHYHRALTSRIRFTTPQLAYIKAALEEELIHLEFLNANGGKALADTFYFPEGTFRTARSFGNVSAIAETVFVGAYLAATRRFAELGNSLLAATAAQVAVVEGQHLALVRETAQVLPNNIALGEPIFFNVSDAVGAVQPLLTGKEGGLGPMEKEPVTYPGAETLRKAIGRSQLSPVKPFVDPSAFPPAAATASATVEATSTK